VGQLSSLDPRLAALSGQTIADRYLVGEALGVGGMGAVFRAQQLKLKRDVAIKVLNPDSSEREEGKLRFAREAESAARLDHENCVQVYDFGTTEDGIHYMVMPILEGQSLGDRYRHDRCSPRQTAELARQLFAGLDHAHSRGVVHRDLKPDNLFLVRDGKGSEVLKIVDFGIAKLIEGGDGPATQQGLLYGTPAYMSPEQAAGDPIDTRTDLFSAGLIVYRLMMGNIPGRAKTALDQMRKRATQEVPVLPPMIPEPLRELVAKLCTLDRETRIPTAIEAHDRCVLMLNSWRSADAEWNEPVDLDDDPTEEDLPYATPTDGTAVTDTRVAAGRRWIPVAAGATAIGCFALAWAGMSNGPEAASAEPASTQVTSVATMTSPEPASTAEKLRPPRVDPPADPGPEIEGNSLQQLAQVNQADPDQALPYAERHALFARLEANPKTASLLDHRANLAIDLHQASQTKTPCESYLATLRTMESSRDPYFTKALESAALPTVGGEACSNEAELAARRATLVTALAKSPSDDAADKKTPEHGPRPTHKATPGTHNPADSDELNPQGSVIDKLDG
jgi:serine/threonine protein kinase